MYKNKRQAILLLSSIFGLSSIILTACGQTQQNNQPSEQAQKELKQKDKLISDLQLEVENIKVKLQNASKFNPDSSSPQTPIVDSNKTLEEQILQLKQQLKLLEDKKVTELQNSQKQINDLTNENAKITKQIEDKLTNLAKDNQNYAKQNVNFLNALKNDSLYKNFDQVNYSPTLFNDSNKFIDGSEEAIANSNKYLLENSFNQEKSRVKELIWPILAQDILVNSKSNITADNFKDKILQNQSKILLALTYINKWYNFNIGDFNFKKFILYDNPNLQKDNKSFLDFIIQIGSKQPDDYSPQNVINFYEQNLRPEIDSSKDFFSFIEAKVKEKEANTTVDHWFNEQIKSFLYQPENKLNVQNKEEITTKTTLWKKLTSEKFKTKFGHLIPTLLTARQENSGLFVVNTIGAVVFGNQKFYDHAEMGADRVANNSEALKNKLKKFGDRLEGFFELNYNLASTSTKDQILNKLFIFDSLWDGKDTWSTQENLLDKTKEASYDFFSTLDYWQETKNVVSTSVSTQNTTNEDDVFKLTESRFLTEIGIETIIGKIANNLQNILFENHKPRNDVKEEMLKFDFAKYLFDSRFFLGLTSIGSDTELGKLSNQSLDYSDFQDLQARWKNAMSLIYTLENIEAELKLNLTKNTDKHKTQSYDTEENKAKLFLKVSTDRSSHNKFETIKQNDIKSLTKVDDLVDKDYVSSWGYTTNDSDNKSFDLFNAFYGTADKTDGVTGPFSMRRNTFELFAELGWENGILPYLTDKLNKKNDSEVITSMFSYTSYKNLKEFKKAMYKQAKEKEAKLKDVEAKGFTDKYKTYKLSAEKIKEILSTALEYDLSIYKIAKNSYSNVRDSYFYVYKHQIFSSFYIATNGFKNSIYKDE